MLEIHKKRIRANNHSPLCPIAVQIPLAEFERLEEAIENYGLVQLMSEVQDDERLTGEDAYNHYMSLSGVL